MAGKRICSYLRQLAETERLARKLAVQEATYGRITSTRPAPQVQFALRYLF